MSKKKRQLREKSAALGRTKSSAAVAHKANKQIDDSGQLNAAAGGFGLLRNLKAHWRAVILVGFLSLGAIGAGLKYLEEDARRQKLSGNYQTESGQSQSFLNRINPFLPAPLPNPTPQLSKEYVYAGDLLLAVEDANAAAVPPADLAVWRPSNGYWYVMGPGGSLQVSFQWGVSIDKPVAGDYDGDGKTDFSVFRPDDTAHTGTWYIYQSSNNAIVGVQFGIDTDKPAMADYDGDGKTDIAVVRPGGTPGYTSWYILKSSDSTFYPIDFGNTTDIPAPADYDGDGKADVGVWRDTDKTFYSLRSSNGSLQTAAFTQNSTEPVSADYDGDGKADHAIRNGANWIILNSSSWQFQTVAWQMASDKAVRNDYDGDGKVDVAVWRGAESSAGAGDAGNWYIRNSSTGNLRQENWGSPGDIPVPAFYRR